jgi:hypothetical protein
MRPSDNSLSWWSLLGLGVLVVVLHQILVLPLSVYEMTQRKTLPEDAVTYILYVLCWPFMLASRAGFTKKSMLIASWFLGSVFLGFSCLPHLRALSDEAYSQCRRLNHLTNR